MEIRNHDKSFSFEIRLVIILLVIMTIVISTGLIAYKSITGIVHTVKEDVKPDVKLALLKDILSNLSDAESGVKSYLIAREEIYLAPFFEAASSIDRKLDSLQLLNKFSTQRKTQTDSVAVLVEQKFSVLNELLKLSEDDRVSMVLEKISEQLETHPAVIKQEALSANIPDDNKQDLSAGKKSTIITRLFGKSGKDRQQKDPSVLGMKKEIAKIKLQESEWAEKYREAQLELNKKDKEITDKIRLLVLKMEEDEVASIKLKTLEAESKARTANRWIALFCFSATSLLFIIGWLMVRYVVSSTAYRKALDKARMEAENLAQTKENFLANMSHEIRTPLHAIAGFTEQLLYHPMKREQRDQLGMIRNSTKHLLGIINDILDYSKLGANKMELERIGFSPRGIIQSVIEMFEPQIEKKNVTMHLEIERGMPEVLIGDPVRLRQILLNLIGNAIKFTNEGSIAVLANHTIIDSGNMYLQITVSDTGVGIPADKMNNIFNEFEQGDISTTRKFGGTGLGLPITKKLIELQGGTIEVLSNEGCGAKVEFNIPYHIGSSDDLPPAEEVELPETGLLSNRKLLVADDEEYNIKLLTAILKKWKVNFDAVSNGQEVLDALQKKRYDIVLMDVRMPVMDGIEATKKIKKMKEISHLPIIALTAATNDDEINKMNEAGMDECLAKPFTEMELFEKILSALDIHPAGKKHKKMKTEIVKEPSGTTKFALEELYNLGEGDEKFVKDMLELFIRNMKEDIELVKKGLAEQSWDNVALHAHKMMSPCRHLNMVDLLTQLRNIENNARNEEGLDELPELIRKYEEDASEIIGMLQEEISRLEEKG